MKKAAKEAVEVADSQWLIHFRYGKHEGNVVVKDKCLNIAVLQEAREAISHKLGVEDALTADPNRIIIVNIIPLS